jgi:hypothetical protein
MPGHVRADTAQYRPAALAGCATCTERGDGLACAACWRRWRDHGKPDRVPPRQPYGQRPGASALFWTWLYMDQTRPAASLAAELGVASRTIWRWQEKRDRLIAEGKIDPAEITPPAPPTPRSLKLSDSRYGAYGASRAAGYLAAAPGPVINWPAWPQLEAAS